MLVNSRLHIRAAFFRAIRSFFYEQGFLEVDTPVRIPLLIPESNIQPLGSDGWFLQTSPELYMKRLLAVGNEKIFQICPCFRKEERGRLHSEEFTMLEWYRTGQDYTSLMEDCQQLIRYIADRLKGVSGGDANVLASVTSHEYLGGDWPRFTVSQAFQELSPVPLDEAIAKNLFDEILVEHIEPYLGVDKPTFLCEYPVQMASLAKVSENNDKVAERFELYMKGIELANGFSELTDPVEQERRFQIELECIAVNGGKQKTLPHVFLKDIGNIDSAAGIALGLDRLLMILLGERSLDQVTTFSPDDFDY